MIKELLMAGTLYLPSCIIFVLFSSSTSGKCTLNIDFFIFIFFTLWSVAFYCGGLRFFFFGWRIGKI